jgi:peptidoglycan/xylan/chitin deacetylase (PgdA/CDA1 family)
MSVASKRVEMTSATQSAQHHVYLTFDDGPDQHWTPHVLDVLAAAQVRATFFMIGLQAVRFGPLVRRIAAEGHEVGNHTFSHRHPWTLATEEARQEVRTGAATLANILGHAPRYYRPPHGRHRRCMEDEAHQQGETIVMWNVSAIDWGPLGDAERISQRLRRIQPGDIALMHDGRNRHNRPDELLRALPGFLSDLRARDLHAASLGEA